MEFIKSPNNLKSALFQVFFFDSPPFIHVAARFNEETIPTDWAEIKAIVIESHWDGKSQKPPCMVMDKKLTTSPWTTPQWTTLKWTIPEYTVPNEYY